MGVQRSLDHKLHNFERVLNFVGYVPFASSLSAPVRAVLGKVEIVGGVGTAALTLVSALFAKHKQKRAAKALQIGTTYPLNGLLNIVRACFEGIPFLSWFTCVPYDIFGGRVSYPYEEQSSSHSPGRRYAHPLAVDGAS